MIVCVCHRISDRDIHRQAQAGCTSFDELQFETGVSTCCGRCTDCAKEEFHRARRHAAAFEPGTLMGQVQVAAFA